MRALFFGTPEFAVPALQALSEIAEVVGVVCQPDRPAGRGNVLTAPPVKLLAEELGLPVTQPTKLRDGTFAAWVREQNVDVALTIAYGRILPLDVLEGPRLGCVNLHASLLPKLRGAAPITWAVVRGETETGVTLMKMDVGMDTGDILEKFPTEIGPDETAGELSLRLSAISALAVRKGLPKYMRGEYVPVPQQHDLATLAQILKKEDGRMDFTQPARRLHDHVRGMAPWPGAFTKRGDKVVKVLETRVSDVSRTDKKPGEVLIADKTRVLVACQPGALELTRVQLEGKKPVTGPDWAMGRGVAVGDVLGG
jgi:methionyl-tRNA formyltransferase